MIGHVIRVTVLLSEARQLNHVEEEASVRGTKMADGYLEKLLLLLLLLRLLLLLLLLLAYYYYRFIWPFVGPALPG